MPIIGVEELAKAMYDAWRKRMDLIEPLAATADSVPVRSFWPERVNEVPIGRLTKRQRWEHLTSIQQSVWRDVAREIGGVLADAMGAV